MHTPKARPRTRQPIYEPPKTRFIQKDQRVNQSPDQPNPMTDRPANQHALRITIVILLLTAVLLWIFPLLNPHYLIRSASAEQLYHTPAIDRFASQLPTPDYSDYSSATTPGYHTVLAIPTKLGASNPALRIIASIYTFFIVALLAIPLARTHRALAIPMILPLLASNYFIFSGAWLLPDNSGWLGVLIIFLLALKPNPTLKSHILAGLTLLILIYFRQVHIWAAAPIWLAAWIGSTDQTPHAPTVRSFFSNLPNRFSRALIALLCTIPAFLLLAYFVKLWGGLVTPTFKDEHHGPNPATPAFILLQIAVFSIFFLPILLPQLKQLLKDAKPTLLISTTLGTILAIVPQSAYNEDAGRYSGWWNAVKKFPDFMDRSPVYIAGAIVGSIMLVTWGSLLNLRDRWIFAGTLLAFTLAQTANLESWQRYHEPMLLFMLMLIFARSNKIQLTPKRAALGSIAASIMLAVITASLLKNQVSRDITDPRVLRLDQRLDNPTPEVPQNQRTTPDSSRTTP
jgi:hypothetical protein